MHLSNISATKRGGSAKELVSKGAWAAPGCCSVAPGSGACRLHPSSGGSAEDGPGVDGGVAGRLPKAPRQPTGGRLLRPARRQCRGPHVLDASAPLPRPVLLPPPRRRQRVGQGGVPHRPAAGPVHARRGADDGRGCVRMQGRPGRPPCCPAGGCPAALSARQLLSPPPLLPLLCSACGPCRRCQQSGCPPPTRSAAPACRPATHAAPSRRRLQPGGARGQRRQPHRPARPLRHQGGWVG